MKPSRSYHADLIQDLKDPKEAAAYLNAALEEGAQESFLVALRNVAEARGGMTLMAKRVKMHRVSLYKMLSKDGNPEFESILSLLNALNVQLRFAPKNFKSKIAA